MKHTDQMKGYIAVKSKWMGKNTTQNSISLIQQRETAFTVFLSTVNHVM